MKEKMPTHLKVLSHIASNPIKWTVGLGAAGLAIDAYRRRKNKKNDTKIRKKKKSS